MRVVISAGGTGGHIYPALAIINKIKEKEPNSEFLYIGTHDRMEKDIIPKYDIPFESIEIYGFQKGKIKENIKAVKCLTTANKKCKQLIKKFNPDVVIGVGGYVTVPVIKMAKKLGYKTFIHEQNSIPGKANRYLSHYVDKIGLSFESSKMYFDNKKVVITGNPCSEDAINVKKSKKSEFGLSDNKPLVLFVMGSLGASRVNDFLVNTMSQFNNKPYEILYVTGTTDYDRISKMSMPKNVFVVPYIDKMTRIMKNTDIMVTRAGASTLSEIMALQIPSIIIPSPYVTNNHQYKNALDLVNNEAGFMIEEKSLKGDIIVRTIDQIINDFDLLDKVKNNLKKMNIANSATIIYDTLKALVDRK